MNTIESISNIRIGNKKLIVIYNKVKDSLSYYFKSDEDMKNYIANNMDDVFNRFVEKKSKEEYILNIASTENFGAFDDWKGMQSLLDRQLSAFMPIIQKFILYANTNCLP